MQCMQHINAQESTTHCIASPGSARVLRWLCLNVLRLEQMSKWRERHYFDDSEGHRIEYEQRSLH